MKGATVQGVCPAAGRFTQALLIPWLCAALAGCVARSATPTTARAQASSPPASPPRTHHFALLDKKAVLEVLLAHDVEVQACYTANGLSADIPREEAVVLFRVGQDGHVAEPTSLARSGENPAKLNAQMEAVEGCLSRAVSHWGFPLLGPNEVAYLTCRLPARAMLEKARATGDAPTPFDPTLDPNNVARAVREILPQLNACYERRLQERPSLQGKITVHWTIDLDGRVPIAEVEQDTVGDDTVSFCVTRKIVEIAFPPPLTSVDVSFPFVFQRGP